MTSATVGRCSRHRVPPRRSLIPTSSRCLGLPSIFIPPALRLCLSQDSGLEEAGAALGGGVQVVNRVQITLWWLLLLLLTSRGGSRGQSWGPDMELGLGWLGWGELRGHGRHQDPGQSAAPLGKRGLQRTPCGATESWVI